MAYKQDSKVTNLYIMTKRDIYTIKIFFKLSTSE